MDDDLCYLSATEAIARFKAKQLSPVELMRAVIERAEKVEPQINAFTDKYFEQALAQAAEAEAHRGRDVRDIWARARSIQCLRLPDDGLGGGPR